MLILNERIKNQNASTIFLFLPFFFSKFLIFLNIFCTELQYFGSSSNFCLTRSVTLFLFNTIGNTFFPRIQPFLTLNLFFTRFFSFFNFHNKKSNKIIKLKQDADHSDDQWPTEVPSHGKRTGA